MGVIVWLAAVVVIITFTAFGFGAYVIVGLICFAAGLWIGLEDEPQCPTCHPSAEDLG